jgi:protein SCO1/2
MSRLSLVLCMTIAAAGCSRAPEPKEYPLTGQILAITPERREVTIRHEDIPNFMPGMTMPFTVRDTALLEGKEPGDLVTGTLVVGEVEAYLSTLTTTGHAPVESPPTAGAPRFLRPGDPVADAPLVDQDGTPRPLSSFAGHRVALTFVYTRCPIPEFCPLMNRHFAAMQKAVKARPDLADVRLVTVTLDPAFDTPPVLKAHAGVFNADPAVWSFLTGDPAEVRAFAEQFGIHNEADPQDPSQIIHSLRTAVIAPDGRLVTNESGNDWTPTELLADITATPAAAH